MDPSDRRRWLAVAPPDPPPAPKRPPPPGKWKAGWRAIADDLLAEEPPAAPQVGPPRPKPEMPYRRHRADIFRRYHLDPATLEAVKAELQAREWDRRRAALADAGRSGPVPGADQGVELEQV